MWLCVCVFVCVNEEEDIPKIEVFQLLKAANLSRQLFNLVIEHV